MRWKGASRITVNGHSFLGWGIDFSLFIRSNLFLDDIYGLSLRNG